MTDKPTDHGSEPVVFSILQAAAWLAAIDALDETYLKNAAALSSTMPSICTRIPFRGVLKTRLNGASNGLVDAVNSWRSSSSDEDYSRSLWVACALGLSVTPYTKGSPATMLLMGANIATNYAVVSVYDRSSVVKDDAKPESPKWLRWGLDSLVSAMVSSDASVPKFKALTKAINSVKYAVFPVHAGSINELELCIADTDLSQVTMFSSYREAMMAVMRYVAVVTDEDPVQSGTERLWDQAGDDEVFNGVTSKDMQAACASPDTNGRVDLQLHRCSVYPGVHERFDPEGSVTLASLNGTREALAQAAMISAFARLPWYVQGRLMMLANQHRP